MEGSETRVLGAALSEPGLWLAQAPRINLELFSQHRKLAEQILAMHAQGQETDPKSVHAYLTQKGIAYRLSDLMFIADQSPLSPASMRQAVDILHEVSKRDAIRKLGNEMIQATKQKNTLADDIVASAVAGLSDIAAQSAVGPKPFREVLQITMNELGRPLTKTVKTGIGAIDHVTGGFQPGQLIVIGARPSMGKTSLALGFVRQAAQQGKNILVLSLEMSAEQVCHRILADLSKVSLAQISTHQLGSREFTALVNAANVANGYRIWVGESADNIDPVARQIKHRHGLDLVVVDYLQLMDIRAESREQQIATLSRGLKRLARALRVPVIVLSQLNRNLEQRANKRPTLADLRESGAIEQDADIVMLLWRPGYYNQDDDQTEAELIVAKHRNGPTGMVGIEWQSDRAQFVDRNKAI